MTWAERITAAWNKSRDGILEVGQLLIEAKVALGHGEFEKMITDQLPFNPSTAQRLMIIARDDRLVNPAHAQYLPPSWYTLYELTKLDDDVFAKAVKSGIIKPDMERKDVVALASRRVETEHEVYDPQDRQFTILRNAWKMASKKVRILFIEWIREQGGRVFGLDDL